MEVAVSPQVAAAEVESLPAVVQAGQAVALVAVQSQGAEQAVVPEAEAVRVALLQQVEVKAR